MRYFHVQILTHTTKKYTILYPTLDLSFSLSFFTLYRQSVKQLPQLLTFVFYSCSLYCCSLHVSQFSLRNWYEPRSESPHAGLLLKLWMNSQSTSVPHVWASWAHIFLSSLLLCKSVLTAPFVRLMYDPFTFTRK